MAGALVKSWDRIATCPWLLVFSLQTLAVSAGNRCSGWPKAYMLSGCTWNWMLGCARPASLRVNTSNCEGDMLMGPL